ncbi:zf-HC2 domain-containing protein [Candidatus Formimonas warabiya]|uniref:Anti-sigma-W factor RsiW n=1 Tax=Formimonas warabiya TaxID=1761012 RepID=A0A3G1KU88_FORW1|nr:zf-HC2 domain-containing protein [Candidatus Formimonas warabiya]ATW26006.1 hypothetical protein DCMF_15580 [Candidatus Formimonas warabiya]
MFFPYVDHELSLQEEKALDDHLSLCTDCRTEFGLVQDTDDLLKKALGHVIPPVDLTDRIMAQIPFPCEKKVASAAHPEEVLGLAARMKKYFRGLGEGWKRLAGGWQFRTAAVTLGLCALVLAGSWGNIFGTPLVKKQPPDDQIAYVNPDPAKTSQVPDSEADVTEPTAPADSEPNTDTEPKDTNPKGTEPKDVDHNPASGDEEQKPDSEASSQEKPAETVSPPETDVIELPLSATGQTQKKTIEVVPLFEDKEDNASYPVLSGDGKFVHYLVSDNGDKEEWKLELKEGAKPQIAQGDLVFQDGKYEAPKVKIPEWLTDTEPVKDARSKEVAWAPGQRQVAINLNSPNPDSTGLWIGQADGSVLMQVAPEGGGRAVAWSPDGRKIAFTDPDVNLYVFYVEENMLVPVTNSSENEKFTSLAHFVWTPDSKGIIFDGKKNADSPKGIYRVTLP